MDWKRFFTSFAEIFKNFIWETQFLSLGEVILTWLLNWKWTLFLTSAVGSLFLLAFNIILIAIIPVADGEYNFRDIVPSHPNECKWRNFPRYHSNKWKYYIATYQNPFSDSDDKDHIGHYEITSASVYKYSSGYNRNASLMEPVETRILMLLCQKKGKTEVFLTFEKSCGVPNLNWLKLFFGSAKKSGIFVQLSGSRDMALTPMRANEHRPIIDVGKRKWRKKRGSKITVGRLLDYYTQKSSDLSADYHIYYSNSYHFVDAMVNILQQMQDDDLSNDLNTSGGTDESYFFHSLFQVAVRFIAQFIL